MVFVLPSSKHTDTQMHSDSIRSNSILVQIQVFFLSVNVLDVNDSYGQKRLIFRHGCSEERGEGSSVPTDIL